MSTEATPDPKLELKQRDNSTAKAVEKMQQTIAKLDPDTQEALARLGVRIPGGDITAALEGRHSWGLRCTKCNEIALYFVGTEFIDLNNNQVYDEPKSHMQIDQIPWTQNLPASEIDRSTPKCQSCHHPVERTGENCFNFQRRLVRLDGWVASRDASFDRKALSELRNRVANTPDVVVGQDGVGRPIVDRINTSNLEAASAVLARTNPEALRAIKEIDGMFAHQGGFLKALAAEASKR